MHRTPARLVTASLLLASAAAFATGVAIERTTTGSESHPTEQHADAGAHATPAASPATAATPSARAVPVPTTTTNAVAPASRPTSGGDGGNGEAGTASPVEATPGSDEHSAPPRPAQSPATTSPAATSGARSAAGDADNGNPAATSEPAASETGAAPGTESQSEKLFGINPEATGLVIIAVALSLLLAALILTVGSSLVPAGVAAAMLAFTVLDVREVTHQLTESRSGLAALAATVALLHLLTAVSALLMARAARSRAG